MTTHYSGLKVSELRRLCQEKNIATTGFLEKGDFVNALVQQAAPKEAKNNATASSKAGAVSPKRTRRATVAAAAATKANTTPMVDGSEKGTAATKARGGAKAAPAGRRASMGANNMSNDSAKPLRGKATAPKETSNNVTRNKRASVATPPATTKIEDPKKTASNRRQSTPATETATPNNSKANKRGSIMTSWLSKKVSGRKKPAEEDAEEEEEASPPPAAAKGKSAAAATKRRQSTPATASTTRKLAKEEEDEVPPATKVSPKKKAATAAAKRRQSTPALVATGKSAKEDEEDVPPPLSAKGKAKPPAAATAKRRQSTPAMVATRKPAKEDEEDVPPPLLSAKGKAKPNKAAAKRRQSTTPATSKARVAETVEEETEEEEKKQQSPPTSPPTSPRSALKPSSFSPGRKPRTRISPRSKAKPQLPGLRRQGTKRRQAVTQQPLLPEDIIDSGSDSEEEAEEAPTRKGVAFALPESDSDEDPPSDPEEPGSDMAAKRASFLATKGTRCRKARVSVVQPSFATGPLFPGAFEGLDDSLNDSSHTNMNDSSHGGGLGDSSHHGRRGGMDDSSHMSNSRGGGGSRRRRSSVAARGATKAGARRSARRRSSGGRRGSTAAGRRKTCSMEDWRRRSTWQGDNSWMGQGEGSSWHLQNSTNYVATDVAKAFKEAPPHKWHTEKFNVGGSEPITLWVGEMKRCEGKSIQKAVKKFQENPHKYCALMYQTNMLTWPTKQQKYTFVMRVDDELVTPQGVTENKKEAWMTVMTHQFRHIPAFPDNKLPEASCDAYTRTLTYKGQPLPLPILPGRGMGTADMPNLKVIGDIDPSDIAQGKVEDCWLLSAISSLAEFDGAIKKIFRKTEHLGDMPFEDGRPNMYTITLYDLETWKEVDYVIDESLCAAPNPTYPGELLGARPSEDGELWVCYLEKALAIHCGGWDAIAGGKCTHAWAIMTGCQRQFQIIKNQKTGKFKCYGKYNSATKVCRKHSNSPMLDAETWQVPWPRVGGGGNANQEFDDDQLYKRMCAWDDYNYIVGAGTAAGLDTTEGNLAEGIVEDHAYSVIDCHPNVAGTGIDLLKVRNPWGEGEIENGDFDDDGPGWALFPEIGEELKPVAADDGIFYLTKEEFFELFDHIYLSCSNMTQFKED